MKKIEIADLKNLHEYELIRDDWRREVIAAKARRRVLVGPTMSLVFENRLTVLNQVQEMCRAERLAKPAAVQQEIDVYNELLPDAGELSATLLVEITEEARIQPQLDRLIGLSSGRHVWLELNGRKVFARFLEGQGREDRIAAVQYLRFPIGTDPADRQALARGLRAPRAPTRAAVKRADAGEILSRKFSRADRRVHRREGQGAGPRLCVAPGGPDRDGRPAGDPGLLSGEIFRGDVLRLRRRVPICRLAAAGAWSVSRQRPTAP